MKNVAWTFLVVLVLGMSSCGKSRDKRLAEIMSYKESLSLDTKELDGKSGDSLMNLYVAFAKDYPKDSLSVYFWRDAADVAMNINKSDLAIAYLDTLIINHPDFPELPEVYFMKGFVYQDGLYDLDKAQKTYELFLQKYPDHPLASNAKILIETLHMTTEELIEKIINQGETKDTIPA